MFLSTPSELKLSVKKAGVVLFLKDEKASGPAGISGEVLKLLYKYKLNLLLSAYKSSWNPDVFIVARNWCDMVSKTASIFQSTLWDYLKDLSVLYDSRERRHSMRTAIGAAQSSVLCSDL